MKPRNKKTGEVEKCEAITIQTDIRVDDYSSLAELSENWEDFKEPILRGEVREIVRRWANLHGYVWLTVGFTECENRTIFWVEPTCAKNPNCIEFLGAYVADDFEAGKYTIDELCGGEKK